MNTLLSTTKPVVTRWWAWAWSVAERYHQRWVHLPPTERNHWDALEDPPPEFEVAENYFFPRIQAKVPQKVQESVNTMKEFGYTGLVSHFLLDLLKLAAPGGA